MGKEQVTHHLREGMQRGTPFSCATACLYAILPFEPSEETEAAFLYNIGTPFIKKVPLATLDRRVRVLDEGSPASVAFTAFPEVEKFMGTDAPYHQQSLGEELRTRVAKSAGKALQLSREKLEWYKDKAAWDNVKHGTKRKRRLARRMKLTADF